MYIKEDSMSLIGFVDCRDLVSCFILFFGGFAVLYQLHRSCVL